MQPKKSSSYTKLTANISLNDKDPKIDKQPLKYCRSSKEITKSLHTTNKS